MALWKINCMEKDYPGMWQRWFRNQCVAVGWPAKWGFPLLGPVPRKKGAAGWRRTRAALQKMKEGDFVVVALSGHRVSRLGRITSKEIGDSEWNPLVPPNAKLLDGEMGRRVLVRWDMTVGPESRDMVVSLPENCRFTLGELRPTIAQVRSIGIERLERYMNDPANWQGLLSHFDYERSLSGYIATYPHHLEDGLTLHPSLKIREMIFEDRSRTDVVLLDRNERTVIVECKQGALGVRDVQQLRGYLKNLAREKKIDARGILVHGGAKKLRSDVAHAASMKPEIEVVQHTLRVEFA